VSLLAAVRPNSFRSRRYAIFCVFFTSIVFPLDTPFHPNQVHECGEFLVCTEQIMTFVFSHLGAMFVNPHMDLIVTSMARDLCRYHPSNRTSPNVSYFKTIPDDSKQDGKVDINYLFVRLPRDEPTDVELMASLSNMVLNTLHGHFSVVSQESITDLFSSLKGRMLKVLGVHGRRVSCANPLTWTGLPHLQHAQRNEQRGQVAYDIRI